MPTLVNCPSCQRKLKVPDELLGKKVKCPGCSTTFTAEEFEETPAVEEEAPRRPRRPLREEEDFDEEPPRKARRRAEEPREEEEYEDEEFEDRPRRRGRNRGRARDAVSAPATCLMVTGIIGIVLATLGAVINALSVAGRAVIPNQGGPGAQPQWANVFGGGIGLVFNFIAIGIGVLIVMGALRMKNLRSYGMAMSASIVAMIPCISPCCLLGLPFGIWALVVLMKPEVKNAFS